MITFKRTIVNDDNADFSWLDQTDDEMGDGFEEYARERKEAWERGEWSMVGIIVTAHAGDQEIGSASLWGIESDSGDDYFNEIEQELKAELTSGFPALANELTAYVNGLEATKMITEQKTAVVSVRGGVAYVEDCPDGFAVEIIDYDECQYPDDNNEYPDYCTEESK